MTTARNIETNDKHIIASFLEMSEQIILGKSDELKLMLTCILANGHLLIEDVPGVGKTTFVKTLQRLTGLEYSRLQFTNDMLPADILGGTVYNQNTNEFSFRKGPIFCELLLADEINRATPKTQSACLQAMEEREVSIDGQTHALPDPFFVVATQNPKSSIGTFSLPESQLDRFLMRIKLGFPSREAEKRLLMEPSRKSLLDKYVPILDKTVLKRLQLAVNEVYVAEPIIEYIQDILDCSRQQSHTGLSPRAAIDLVNASKAHAFINGKSYVQPQDVVDVAAAVMNHRLKSESQLCDGWDEAHKILKQVPIR